MKEQNRNYWIDWLGFALISFLLSTGLVLKFVLPPGSGRRLTVWGWTRHEWGNIHFLLAMGFAVVVLIHLVVHWRWLSTAMTGFGASSRKWSMVGAVVAFLVVASVACFPFMLPVEGVPGGGWQGQ